MNLIIIENLYILFLKNKRKYYIKDQVGYGVDGANVYVPDYWMEKIVLEYAIDRR